MMRRTLLVVVVSVLAVAPASAFAAKRYASPTRLGNQDCSSPANACDLVSAVSGAGSNDEVIVAGNAGTYGTPAVPIMSEVAPLSGAPIYLHGAAGQPRPVIYLAHGGNAIDMWGGAISGLELEMTGGSLNSALPTTLYHMLVRSSSTACYGDSTIVDSVCAGSQGAALTSGCSTPCTDAVPIRNSTIIGSSGAGLDLEAGNGQPGPTTIAAKVTNSIIRGGGVGAPDIYTSTESGQTVTVRLDHSNYASVDSSHGGTVTPAGSGSNQTAAPRFVNASAGNFREAAGSPTIDRGVNSPLNGPTDLDGNPRAMGASADIGAYEFFVKPRVSRLRIKPSQLKRGGQKRATVRYSDSDAGTTLFRVYRLVGKHRKLVGGFRHSDRAGSNSVKFSGRLRGKKLKPGRYVLVAVPHLGGLVGRPASVRFRIM